ncbi:hypothetical protein HYH03_019014, partial [Edaphochlamys debaryana]
MSSGILRALSAIPRLRLAANIEGLTAAQLKQDYLHLGNYIRAYRAGERLHADFVASLAAEDEEEPLGRWADEVDNAELKAHIEEQARAARAAMRAEREAGIRASSQTRWRRHGGAGGAAGSSGGARLSRRRQRRQRRAAAVAAAAGAEQGA